MRIALISFTKKGTEQNQKLCQSLSQMGDICQGTALERFAADTGLRSLETSLKEWTKTAMQEMNAVIFIGACGIAVRSIAPFIRDKYRDPAVLVMDEQGKFVISLLSGHVGGANCLAHTVATLTGAIPVISTATDLNKKFAVDAFAIKNGLWISDRFLAKKLSVAVLEGHKVGFWCETPVQEALPEELEWMDTEKINQNQSSLEVGIGVGYPLKYQKNLPARQILWLIPRNLYLGIGCKKGTPAADLEIFIKEKLEEMGLCMEMVAAIASIDRKKEEPGIQEFCKNYHLPFFTYTEEKLRTVSGSYEESEFVRQIVGIGNICQRAAVLASKGGTVILPKTAKQGMTLAIAEAEWRVRFE